MCMKARTKSGRSALQEDLAESAESKSKRSSASKENAMRVVPQMEVKSAKRTESRTGITDPTSMLSGVGIVEPYRRL